VKALLLALALLAAATSSAAAATDPTFAAGAYHGCSALTGRLYCLGDNSAGELGDGTSTNRTSPVPVIGLPTPVAEVSASYDRTCAIAAGRLYCWGRQAKPAASPTPVKVGKVSGAHGLAVGVTHACVLDATGGVWCWGANDRGQLGDGKTKNQTKPIQAKVGAAAQLAAADGYTCALLAAGGVSCWGRSHGTAGDPLNPEGLVVNSKKPTAVVGLGGATAVSATGDFACATVAGQVLCWGENDHGQLGDGTLTGRRTPLPVAGLAAASRVVATANHACALSGGDVFCWGRGDHGQLGNGTIGESHTPVAALVPPIARLYGAASGHWTMAQTTDGRWYSWGRNDYGQLADGSTTDQPTPVPATIR
jgi:alpha-tubulin suppressor-like RCC1 family protein